MSQKTDQHSSKLFAKYHRVISIFKKISKIVGVDRALGICDATFKFNVFHVLDCVLLLHYICSVIYIVCTKFEDKIKVLRPMTLCPIAVQVLQRLINFYPNHPRDLICFSEYRKTTNDFQEH